MAVVLAAPPPADEGGVDRWRPLTEEASARFGVPRSWIEHVIAAESGGRTTLGGRPVRSRAGAMGLMQLMPITWASLRADLHLGGDPDDPHDNILAGTSYLRQMYDRFGYPGLFAAYNAGPQRYARHLETGEPLPAETRVYLHKMTGAGAGGVRPAVAEGPQIRSIFAIPPTGEDPRAGQLFLFRSSDATSAR